MRWLFVFLLLIAGCASHNQHIHPLYKPVVDSTVSIEALWDDGLSTFTATGVLVTNHGVDYLLTSGHVLSITRPDAELVGLMLCSATVIHDCSLVLTKASDKDTTHADEDWVLLALDSKPKYTRPLTKLQTQDPLLGEPIYTAGFPATVFTVNQGNISGYQKTDGHIAYIANIYTSPGSSGSPIVNSKYELIGLISAVKIDFAIAKESVAIVNHNMAVVTPVAAVEFPVP